MKLFKLSGYLLSACLISFGLLSRASAQPFPDKTIQYIIPFPAAGESDLVARYQADISARKFNQPMVVMNRAGAGGALVWSALNTYPADGTTVVGVNIPHTILQPLQEGIQYKTEDINAIYYYHFTPDALMVSADSPYKTYQEFIAAAKKDPGKMNYASSGPGTPYHMAGELFKAMSKTDVVHIPHKASGDARNSVLAGTVQMMFDAVTTMSELAKAGKVQALATTGLKRSPLTPDLPTVAETVPGYEATIWLGVMAPKDTPKDVIAYLNTAINKVINLPEVKEAWLKQGAIPLVMTPPEFDVYLRKDIDKWAEVVKVSGAKVQ